LFEIWIRPVPNETRQFAARAAVRELKSLVDNGLTEEQFDLTRKFLRNYVLHYAPTTSERLGYALDDRFYGVSGSHLDLFRRRMNEVKRAEVNGAVKKYLQYDNLHIVFVTPDAAGLKQALVADASSPITYTSPKSDAVLAEDREISKFPLNIQPDAVKTIPVGELFAK
jgi:zinc protease